MDDLISRQAAIDAVADLYWMDERLLNFKKEIDATFDKIKALPPAQPDPRRGKWIKNEGRYGWHCSACGEDDIYAFAWNCDTGENELQDRYCPNCGAKMERSEE